MPLEEISEKRLAEFIDFPYFLFKNHPFWVGDLKKDALHLLSNNHPFWRHSIKKLFIVKENGKIKGRIAAIVNYNHNNFHNEKCGFFGFFDCINDEKVSSVLFEACFDWLKKQGMETIRGPVNPSTNETCGLLIDGFDSPPVVLMPYNPPYYAQLIEREGFSKAKDLYAFKRILLDEFPQRLEKIVARLTRRENVKIEFADTRNIKEAIGYVKEVYNEAWSKNWGFVPMTEEEIEDMALSLASILKPEYLYFVKIRGVLAGFTLLLSDLNIPLKVANGRLTPFNIIPFLWKMRKMTRGRVLALGIKKDFRNKGLELLMIKEAILIARKLNWEFGELSWMLEDNDKINNILEAIGGKLYKKYRIYEKIL